MLARLSAHCPNFWDVLVNVMLGVMLQLMMACQDHNHKQVVRTGGQLGLEGRTGGQLGLEGS